jgi:hypothetical protein
MRLWPRRKKQRQRTPWEQAVIVAAQRHAVSDRIELEAVEAEVLEHGAPVALSAAGAARPSLRRLLGGLRRRR